MFDSYSDFGGFGSDPLPDPEELRRQAMLEQTAPAPVGDIAPPSYSGGAPPSAPPMGGVTGGFRAPDPPGTTVQGPGAPAMGTATETGLVTPKPPPAPDFVKGYAAPAPTATPAAAPTAPFQYEKARDSWMSGQYGSGEAGARAWAAANGVAYNGGDTITLPNGGGQIDIIGNFAGGAGNGQPMANNWTPAGGNGPNPGGQGPAPSSSGGVMGPSTIGPSPLSPPTTGDPLPPGFTPPPPTRLTATGDPVPPGPNGGGSNPLNNTLRQTLLDQMKASGQPVDENALGISQPYGAAKLAADRQMEQFRQSAAERQYGSQGSGVGSNALGMEFQQGAERNAVGLAGIKSGLIGNEIAAKRTQTQQALQLANSIGARDEAATLTKQLADLDNQFRYAQMGQQESQFGRNLAQQGSQFGQDLGFRYAGLNQQGSQFGQDLGYRYAGLGQQNDQFGRQLGQNQGQWNDRYGLDRQGQINEQNRLALLYGMQ